MADAAAKPHASPDPATAAPRPDRGLVAGWLGLLLAPGSWVVDFMLRYLGTRYASIHERRWPQHMATAIGLGLLGMGVWLSWRARRRQPARDEVAALGTWGLMLAAFFLLLILAEAFPTLVLSPREIS
jgi:hypothetical protein